MIVAFGSYLTVKLTHHRLRLHRYEGQFYYSLVIRLGTICIGFALVCFAILLLIFQEKMLQIPLVFVDIATKVYGNHPSNMQSLCEIVSLIEIAILSFAIAKIWILLEKHDEKREQGTFLAKLEEQYKTIIPDEDERKETVNKIAKEFSFALPVVWRLVKESPLDRIIFTAGVSTKPILITLNNGKVYVGFPNIFAEPNEKAKPNQEVRLFPIYSGYRDKETFQYKRTTDYTVIKENDNIEIVIPQESIVSASYYDKKTFDLLRAEKERVALESSAPLK